MPKGQGAPPPAPLNLLGDNGGGAMFLAFGVVFALLEARTSGHGQVVDAAIVDGAALLMALVHSLRATGIRADTRGRGVLDGGADFHGAYETADGLHVSLGAIGPQFAAGFVPLTGLDERFLEDRMNLRASPVLPAEPAAFLRTTTRDDRCRLLGGSEACSAPVLPFWQAAEQPRAKARRAFIQRDRNPRPRPASRLSSTDR